MEWRAGNRSVGEKLFDVLNYVLLTVITLCTLYPLIYVLFASLSDPTRYMRFGNSMEAAGYNI